MILARGALSIAGTADLISKGNKSNAVRWSRNANLRVSHADFPLEILEDSSALAHSQTGHAKDQIIQGYNLYEIIIHWRTKELAEIYQIAKQLGITKKKKNKKRFKED